MTTPPQSAEGRYRTLVEQYGLDPADWPVEVCAEVYADEELRELVTLGRLGRGPDG
jgi:hypothetical protein